MPGNRVSDAPFNFSGGGVYPSTFFLATGFHGFHVIVGTCFLIVCWFRARAGQFTPERHFGFEAAAWYWHFVDVVWLFLFICIYWWGASSVGSDALNAAIGGAAARFDPSCGVALSLPALREGAAVPQSPGVRDTCEVCGLDLRAHDAGDGAAVGVILLLGAIVVGSAFWVEFRFRPAALGARRPLAGGDDAARRPDDASGEGGAGGVAVSPSILRDGVVTGRLRPLLWPGVMTVAMLALLLGLGTWQVQRLHWKRASAGADRSCRGGARRALPADPEPFTKVRGDRALARRSVCHIRRRGA